MIPLPATWAICTIYMEAQGESFLGKVGVAAVIRNRMKQRRQSVGQVVFAPLQFSCWNSGSPTLGVLDRLDEKIWNECEEAWTDVANSLIEDPTNGANHYLNERFTRQLRSGSLPPWFDEKKVTLREGNHTFLKI